MGKSNIESEDSTRKITYTKEKILTTQRYAHRVDLLGVLLDTGKEYTFAEVDALLKTFMKGVE